MEKGTRFETLMDKIRFHETKTTKQTHTVVLHTNIACKWYYPRVC